MLEVMGVHKTYQQVDHALHILRGIDLQIKEGEVVSIVGPSGAGKSTLLHIMGGLDHPNQGGVILDGDNVYQLNDGARAKMRNSKVGFVFQFYHLLAEFTALENVILPAFIKEGTVRIKKAQRKGEELLKRVGLQKRIGHKPSQLSGGEQQRVAIARALINEPKVVFCDEPTGNLDSESGQEIIKLLINLNKENKQTLVIVTHDDNIAQQSHRKILMRDGKLV